eukprot:COSAG02_NODE_56345_length_286_cov_0.556150_1_plen_33_part_01
MRFSGCDWLLTAGSSRSRERLRQTTATTVYLYE